MRVICIILNRTCFLIKAESLNIYKTGGCLSLIKKAYEKQLKKEAKLVESFYDLQPTMSLILLTWKTLNASYKK